MKRKTVTKIMSYLLTATMLLGGAGLSPLATVEVRAEGTTDVTTKIVNLRLDDNSIAGIENPTSGTNDADSWTGSTVYYGNRAYYVLDKNGQSKNKNDSVLGHSSMDGHMLLFSKAVLEGDSIIFDSATSDWSESDIRNELNDGYYYNKEGVFTGLEQEAISETPISSENTEIVQAGSTIYPSERTEDKIFLLDMDDVYNKNYGFSSNDARWGTRAAGGTVQNDEYWWLRSPYFFDSSHAYIVSVWGTVTSDSVNNSGTPPLGTSCF